MAVITRPTTPLPNPGDEIEAEQVRDWINNVITFIEEAKADEANVNLTATNGIVGKSTNQTITGTKSFASTSTGSGANLTANFILNPSDSTVSANDGPRVAFQTLNNSGEVHDYAYIDAIATTLTATGEAGKLVFSVYESGSAVEAFSITGAGPQFNTNIVSYKDANGADVTISIGTSEPESFNIVADNGGSNKTLEQVTFTSKTASGTANHGKMVFNVDETTILSILDTGLEYVGTLTGSGDVTFYEDANNADVSLAMGTSATESFNVITSNGASDKELYQVDFTTKTAESDADRGKFVFNVDEAEIATIDDDGIELASGKSITAPALTNLGLLYSNSGVISPAPRLFSDGSSTLRIGTSGGSAGGSILLYGDTSGSQVSFNGGSDDVTFNQYEIIHQSSLADKPTITLKNSHADATAGKIIFTKDPSSGQGADNDVMGTVEFFGTDASNNAVEKLAYIDSYIVEADHGSEAAGIRFYVAENDATVTQGLSINGSASVDGRVDVTLGAAATSVITIPGDIDLAGDIDVDGTLEADAITLGGTALGSLYSPVAGSSSIVTTGTIGTGTWAATDIAVAHGGTGASSAADARSNLGLGTMAVAATGDYSVIAGSSSIVTVGTISTGTWNGTAIASAYLDADTAHLSGTQTFTGAKTFTANVTVGVDGTGHDVQFFGDTSGSSVLIDQSADDMILTNFGLAVGSDATGDIYYRNASGFLARLGKGTSGHYLKQGSSIPEWAAVSGGSGGISWDGSTANGVATFKDSDEATVESTLTYDNNNLAIDTRHSYGATIQAYSTDRISMVYGTETASYRPGWITYNLYHEGASSMDWHAIESTTSRGYGLIRFQSGNIDLYSGTASNSAGDAVTPTATTTISDANGAFSMWASGSAAKSGGGSWSNSSDERLKNVGDAYTTGLSDIIQINPKKYTLNGKGGLRATGDEFVGVVAQDVVSAGIFDDCISTRKGKLEESDENETDLYMWDSSNLTYAFVNAFKELKTELDAAKARIAALEGG